MIEIKLDKCSNKSWFPNKHDLAHNIDLITSNDAGKQNEKKGNLLKWNWVCKADTNLLMLLPIHGCPCKFRWLQTVVEVSLAFWIGKEEDLNKLMKKTVYYQCNNKTSTTSNQNWMKIYLRIRPHKSDAFPWVYLGTTKPAKLRPNMPT